MAWLSSTPAPRIGTGATRRVRGCRAHCCRLAIVGVDVLTPGGDVVPVFGNLEAPAGASRVQEVVVVVPAG